jgi:hypothetical protein
MMDEPRYESLFERLGTLEAAVADLRREFARLNALPAVDPTSLVELAAPEPAYQHTQTPEAPSDSTALPAEDPGASLAHDQGPGVMDQATYEPGLLPLPAQEPAPVAQQAVDAWALSEESDELEDTSTVPPQPRSVLDVVKRAEFLLNKVGIMLFLFGVAFLYKYAVDKNWLSDQGRITLGVLLGTVLLVAGMWLHKERRHFSQVLLGGSIATYYITGYASYQVFPDLKVPYEMAFGFMAFVTLLAFVLSVRQGEVILSLIGLSGGLLTPFVLSGPGLKLPWLVGYTCLIVVGTSAIYLFRGWRSLLWNSMSGAWSILLIGYTNNILPAASAAVPGAPQPGDRWALLGGAAFMLVAFWAVPVLREVLSGRDPARWPRPSTGFIKDPALVFLLDAHVYPLVIATPLAALGFSWLLWSDVAPGAVFGWVAVGGAILFSLVSLAVGRSGLGRLAYIQVLMSVALLTIGLVALLQDDALLFALAAEGAALHLISYRFRDKGLGLSGHLLFGIVGAWLAMRLIPGQEGSPQPAIIGVRAITDLAVMALALGVSFVIRSREAAIAYRSCVHVALLAWLWRELHGFPNGDGFVMLAWAAYGLLLHIVSRTLRDKLNSIGTSAMAHLAFEAALGVLAFRMASGYQGSVPVFNEKAVIDLGFMALALVASFVVPHQRMSMIYRLVVHVAVLGWLAREATMVEQGYGYVMLRWAAYLTMVALISHRVGDRFTLMFTNISYLAVGALFVQRVLSGHEGDLAILNSKTLVDAGVIALALTASFVTQPREAAISIRLAVHAALLALIWRELSYLPGGDGYVMLSWAAYLAMLQLLSYRLRDRITSLAAHLPFLLVAYLFAERVAIGPEQGNAVFNQNALTNLAVIILAAIISFVAQPKEAGVWYRYVLHGAVLAWLWREFSQLTWGYEYIILAWAAYATLLHVVSLLVARRWGRDQITFIAAHALFAVSGLWLLSRIVLGLIIVNVNQTPVFNPKGLANLGVIALVLVVYYFLRSNSPNIILFAYGLWLHVAFLGWMWQELGLMTSGNGYVTIAWGAYAIVLIIAGLRTAGIQPLLYYGILTLLAVAAKLFLIDLHYLDAIWRILLFLGFGGLFLLVSYYFQGVMKRISDFSQRNQEHNPTRPWHAGKRAR